MQDISGSSHVHKDIEHPIGPLLYTISCMHCMTVSLAQGGEGLGAVWGEEKAREYLQKPDFLSITTHRLAHDIQNNWYVVTKCAQISCGFPLRGWKPLAFRRREGPRRVPSEGQSGGTNREKVFSRCPSNSPVRYSAVHHLAVASSRVRKAKSQTAERRTCEDQSGAGPSIA